MNTLPVGSLANCLGVARDSVRRWSKDYQPYLSKGANPFAGHDRAYTRHDASVLWFVSVQRQTRTSHAAIREQLEQLRAGGWSDLPDVPDRWFAGPADGRVTIAEVAQDATTLAQMAGLQVEVQNLLEKLQEAISRANSLQLTLDHERSLRTASEARIHTLELDAERAQADVRELRAHLAGYAMSSGKPIPFPTIILVTVLLTITAVLVVFVAAKLLL